MILPLAGMMGPLGSGGAVRSQSYRELIIADGSVAYWRLGEASGTTAADEMGTFPGTFIPSSAGAWTGGSLAQAGAISGDTNTAALLNGSSGYVSIGSSSSLGFARTDPFSIEAWVKLTGTGQYTIFAKALPGPPYTGYALDTVSGKLRIAVVSDVTGGNYIDASSVPAVNNNSWRHAVVTYSGSGTAAGVAFYIDGAAVSKTVATDGLSGSIANSATPNIGAQQGSIFFLGSLDEVAVYSAVLTPAQVLAHYNKGMGL